MNGLCTDHKNPDLWFSDTTDVVGTGKITKAITSTMLSNTLQALDICARCPIIDECREVGMRDENLENGVWGGTLAGERLLLARTNIRAADRVAKINFARRVRGMQRV